MQGIKLSRSREHKNFVVQPNVPKKLMWKSRLHYKVVNYKATRIIQPLQVQSKFPEQAPIEIHKR